MFNIYPGQGLGFKPSKKFAFGLGGIYAIIGWVGRITINIVDHIKTTLNIVEK